MLFCVMGLSVLVHSVLAVDTSSPVMAKKSKVVTVLFALLTLLLTSNCHGIGTSHEEEEETLDPSTMPYFDYSVPRNISQVVGQHAFLLCRVYRMKDKSVSWIRKRDLHILTAGIYTYTTDQRFVVIHPDKSENWTLQIKYPQERDAGVYECQVNTEPKISMAFHLTVIESRARIIGGSDVHVKSGSSLKLTCEVEHGPHDIAQVFWYHGSSIIDPQGLYGDPLASDIRLVTQRGDLLRSQLTIPKVRANHSGNYTCSPTMALAASVHVHVIQGEHPAAMQHGNRSSSCQTHLSSLEYFLLFALVQLILSWTLFAPHFYPCSSFSSFLSDSESHSSCSKAISSSSSSSSSSSTSSPSSSASLASSKKTHTSTHMSLSSQMSFLTTPLLAALNIVSSSVVLVATLRAPTTNSSTPTHRRKTRSSSSPSASSSWKSPCVVVSR